jgi:tetratricopeptide (TPR) repeat protein
MWIPLQKTWNDKDISLKNLKRYDETIECYNKAIQIDLNYASAWNNKGYIILDQSR